MAIPLWTGSAGSLPNVGPPVPSVENLNLDAALKGLQLGQQLPSTGTAIARGVEGAVQQNQQYRLGEASIQKEQAGAQLASAEAQVAQATVGLKPLQIQAQLAREMAETLKTKVDAQSSLQKYGIVSAQLQRRADINDIFSQIDDGDVAGGIGALEQNFTKLTRGGLFENDGSGQKLSPDAGILGNVDDLVNKAQATGDPQLVARAQAIKGKFYGTLNSLTRATTGNIIPQEGQQAPQDPTAAFLQAQGIPASGQGAPVATPAGSAGAPGSSGAPAQQGGQAPIAAQAPQQQLPAAAPDGQAPPATPQDAHRKAAAQAAGLNFPENIGEPSPYVKGEDPYADVAEKDVPISKRLLGKDAVPWFEKRVDAITQENRDKYGMKPDEARRLALEQAKNDPRTWTPEQNKFLETLDTRASSLRQSAGQSFALLRRLKQLSEENGVDVEDQLGQTKPLAQLALEIKAKLPGDNSVERSAIDDTINQLQNLGTVGALQTGQDLGAGASLFRSQKELAALAGLSQSKDNSLSRNMEGTQILDAKAQELDDMRNIIRSYQRRGYDFPTALAAAETYRDLNPALTETSINGKPFLGRNTQKQEVFKFVDDRLGYSKYLHTDSTGRVVNAQPAQPKTVLNQITSGAPTPDGNAIPNLLPQGANAALMHRISALAPSASLDQSTPELTKRQIAAESAGDSAAVSVDKDGNPVARGLMQLKDSTGRQMWKEMGFDGAYDPHDPEKNIIMGTAYMNKMLSSFGGDTRIALAAYNAGPGTISKAMQKAADHTGDTSWDSVKQYLTPRTAEETIPYVEKIMGDRPGLPGMKNFDDAQIQSAYAHLPPAAQATARAALSHEGQNGLAQSKDFKSFQDAPEDHPVTKLAAQLLDPAAAQAQEGDQESPGDTEGAGTSGEARPTIPTTSTETSSSTTTSSKPTVAGQSTGGGNASPPAGGQPSYLQEFKTGLTRLPGAIQSSAMGAARTGLFGFDDEAGALLRMAVHGEPYDQAIATARAIRDGVQKAHPNYYIGGEVGGALYNPIGKAVTGAGGALLRTATGGTAVAAGTAAAKSPGIISSIAKGVVGGAAQGAAQGFGEGEGNLGNREARAIEGGVLGAAFGGPASAIAHGIGALAGWGPFQNAIRTIRAKTTGGDVLPTTLSKAEQRIAEIGAPGSEFQKAADRAKTANNPAYSALDELGDTKAKQLVDAMSKDPDTGDALQAAARQNLESQPDRVKGYLSAHVDYVNAPSEDTFGEAAKAAQSHARDLVDQRKVRSQALYNAVKRDVPAQTRITMPDGSFKNVSEFSSGAVDRATQDPLVARAIADAHNEIDPAGVYPDKSFDILQQASNILADKASAGGKAGRFAKDSEQTLLQAMYKESPKFRAADSTFAAGSRDIEAYNTQLAQKLQKFTDPQKFSDINKFGDTLLSGSPDQIKNFVGSLDENGQQQMKNAVGSWITNQLEKRGARQPGQTQTFPNFEKNFVPEKIKAVFGEEAGQQIVDRLAQEQKISRTSNMILAQTTQTAQRLAEQQKMTQGGAMLPAVKAIGAAVGAVFRPTPEMALFAGHEGLQAFKAAFSAGKITSKQALADELSKILVTDQKAGTASMEKIAKYLGEQGNNASVKFFNEASNLAKQKAASVGGAAGGVTSGGRGDFQPETSKRERQARQATRIIVTPSGPPASE